MDEAARAVNASETQVVRGGVSRRDDAWSKCQEPIHIRVMPDVALCEAHAAQVTRPAAEVTPLPWWELNSLGGTYAIANSMADVLGVPRLPDELVGPKVSRNQRPLASVV